MRRAFFGALALLAFLPAVRALDDPKDKKTADSYESLVKEYQEAQSLVSKAFEEAKTEPAKKKVEEEAARLGPSFSARFLKLAQASPKDPAAVDAYLWVVQNAPFSSEAEKAADAIAKDYLQDKKVGQALARLAGMPTAAVEKLMRARLEKSMGNDEKAQATYSLAQYLASKGEAVQMIQSADDELLKRVEAMAGKDFLNQFRRIDVKALDKESEDLLDRLVRDFPDAKDAQGKKIADEAKNQLFQLRHLGIGKEAPQIEGEDIDGKKLKLTDYRGKVVVLDFWGNW